MSATCPPSTTLSLSNANWVWTNEVSSSLQNAPVGSRAFRGTLAVPSGHTATSASVTITADDENIFYVQGQLVGNGETWRYAQAYTNILLPTPATEVVIAVIATNNLANGGLIAVIELTLDCGSIISFVTDGSWKYDINYPDEFQYPEFDDSAWSRVFVEGGYGIQPWGDIPVQAPGSGSGAR